MPHYDKASVGLVGSLLFIIILQIIFLATQYTNDSLLVNSVFVLIICVTIILFLVQPSDDERLILLVGVSLVSPMLSMPLMSDYSIISSILNDVSIPSDRIQIRNLVVSIVSVLFAIRTMSLSADKKVIVFYIFMITLFILISSSHKYTEFSIYQVIIDFFYLLGAFSVFVYMRLGLDQGKVRRLVKNFMAVMLLFSLVIILDLVISLIKIVPWSISYRGGIQGVLYGFEMLFSFVLSLVVIFLASRMKSYLLKVIVFGLGVVLLLMTNIDSAVFASIFTIIVINKKNRYNNKLILLLFIFIGFLIYFNFNNLIEVNSSLWARLGTYVVGLSMFVDGNIITGIIPGVIDSTMPSNLSNMIYQNGYGEYLVNVPHAISAELLERSEYESGGQFIPHASSIALIVSYGVFFIVPTIYYYFILPYHIALKIDCNASNSRITLARLMLFVVIFSLLHPLILPILIVFLGELLRVSFFT